MRCGGQIWYVVYFLFPNVCNFTDAPSLIRCQRCGSGILCSDKCLNMYSERIKSPSSDQAGRYTHSQKVARLSLHLHLSLQVCSASRLLRACERLMFDTQLSPSDIPFLPGEQLTTVPAKRLPKSWVGSFFFLLPRN